MLLSIIFTYEQLTVQGKSSEESTRVNFCHLKCWKCSHRLLKLHAMSRTDIKPFFPAKWMFCQKIWEKQQQLLVLRI